MSSRDRCPECGSWDRECNSLVPNPECGCMRCAGVRNANLKAEIKRLRGELFWANRGQSDEYAERMRETARANAAEARVAELETLWARVAALQALVRDAVNGFRPGLREWADRARALLAASEAAGPALQRCACGEWTFARQDREVTYNGVLHRRDKCRLAPTPEAKG